MSIRTITSTLAAAGLLAAGAAVPAQAAPPERSVVPFQRTFEAHPMYTAACGFPVSMELAGEWLVLTWTDENGDPVRELRNYRFSSTLSANGKAIEGLSRGPETTVFNADGSTTVHVRGVVNRRVPGEGTVKLSWGSGITIWPADEGAEIVVDPTGGPEDLQPLCDYLAP